MKFLHALKILVLGMTLVSHGYSMLPAAPGGPAAPAGTDGGACEDKNEAIIKAYAKACKDVYSAVTTVKSVAEQSKDKADFRTIVEAELAKQNTLVENIMQEVNALDIESHEKSELRTWWTTFRNAIEEEFTRGASNEAVIGRIEWVRSVVAQCHGICILNFMNTRKRRSNQAHLEPKAGKCTVS